MYGFMVRVSHADRVVVHFLVRNFCFLERSGFVRHFNHDDGYFFLVRHLAGSSVGWTCGHSHCTFPFRVGSEQSRCFVCVAIWVINFVVFRAQHTLVSPSPTAIWFQRDVGLQSSGSLLPGLTSLP